MNRKFDFFFDESTRIFYKYYYGKVSIEDIVSSWRYAIENELIPDEVQGFILDYRQANLDIPVGEYSKIGEFYRDHLNIFGNQKIAIITLNPQDIVIPMLVRTLDNGYSSKPFSTVENAVKWMLNDGG